MLPEIKSILYASDLEPGARQAFRLAISLSRQHDAEITFLHVIEPLGRGAENIIKSYVGDELVKELQDASLDSLKTRVKERLLRFYRQELDEANGPVVRVTPRVEEGPANVVILDIAEQMDADLIIMGTRNHSSPLGQLLLGSTANKIIHQSERPVMVVPLRKAP